MKSSQGNKQKKDLVNSAHLRQVNLTFSDLVPCGRIFNNCLIIVNLSRSVPVKEVKSVNMDIGLVARFYGSRCAVEHHRLCGSAAVL